MALCKLQKGHILLLGEGDFSFSVAFIQQLEPNIRVTSTCLLSSEQLHQLHKSAEENVTFLLSRDVKVIYEVDATKLEENERLDGKKFERIIFNFPHVGGKSNIKKNRALLKDFFSSAFQKLADGGDICVTFCRGQGGTPADQPVRDWNDSWQSVAAASCQNLVLRDIWPFDIKEYPQYKSTGFRSLDKQFHTDGALTYVFCKCLPLPEPVVPPEWSQICIDGVVYLTDSYYLASHGMRCLSNEKGHPVELVLSNIVDKITTLTDLYVEVLNCTSPIVQLHGDTRQAYKLLPVAATTQESLTMITANKHQLDTKNLVSGDNGNSSVNSLYLQRTLLDGMAETVKLGTLHYSYGCVGRRRPHIDCCDLPIKNELIFWFRHSDECQGVSMMKDVIQKTLSAALGADHQVLITHGCENMESWLEAHFAKQHLHSISISGRSYSQSVTVACNQIRDTGKPCRLDQESVKCSKLSRSVGYIGMKQPGTSVAVLDLDILCMMKYDLPDARLLWSNDSAFLDQFKDLKPTDAYCFKPISLYPPLWRHDVSFWDNPDLQFSEQQLVDIIQDVSGDSLKCIKLMNVWKEPSTGRISRCYRQVYQSYDHAISHAFAHNLQNTARLTLAARLGVELR